MNLGLIGIGLMGQAMGERLLECDHQLTIWNRSADACIDLAQAGARVASTPLAVLEDSDFVLLALSDKPAIDAVLGDLPTLDALKDVCVIQTATIAPEQSNDLAMIVSSAGGQYLEAPVLGSLPEARQGTLIIMAGGDEETFNHALPVLECLGQSPARIGEVGQGAALKLAYNQLIASLTTAFGMSLGYVMRHGIQPDLFMKLLRTSALYAPTFDKKIDRMLQHDYSNPNFPVQHLIKDTNLFIRSATNSGIDTRMLDGIVDVLDDVNYRGLGREDYSALFEALVKTN